MPRILLACSLLLLGIRAAAQTPAPAPVVDTAAPAVPLTNIQQAMRSLAVDPSMRNAAWSFLAMDVHTGEVVAEYSPQSSLTPASSMKTLTTSTILHILGRNFRFRTELQYDGRITPDGTLEGNLYLKGYGDPTFCSSLMDGVPNAETTMILIVQGLRAAGIKRVKGAVVGDDSAFDNSPPPTWAWEDLGNAYGATATGLNVCDNQYYVIINQSNRIGEPPTMGEVTPSIPNMQLTNDLTTSPADSEENAQIYGAPNSSARTVAGTLPAGRGSLRVSGSMPEPAYFAAHLLRQTLDKEGIAVSEPITTMRALLSSGRANYSPRTTLYTHLSPTLLEIVRRTNQKSNNLYAETLLKAVGYYKTGIGSSTMGAKVVKAFLESKGIDTRGVYVEDGSGLSSRNAIPTAVFVSLMRSIALDAPMYADFVETLPLAGVSGTLEKWFHGTPAEGIIRAKTGTLRRVLSYTGYAPTRHGRLVAFSLVVNNYNAATNAMRSRLTRTLSSLVED